MIESVKKTALNIAILSILELWVLFCIIYHIVSVVVCSETVYSKQTTIFGPMLLQKSIANVLKIEICPTSLK